MRYFSTTFVLIWLRYFFSKYSRYRHLFKKILDCKPLSILEIGVYKGKIVAISGCVGKTTTKENIYHILNNNKFKTYRSFKNFNNILGLQFSIMNMDIDSKFAVFELGINAPKEMDNLIKILQPHYSLLTSVEDSHIGNFKNFSNLFANKIKIFNSKRLIKGLINIRNDNIQLPKKIINKVKRINLENLNIKAHKHDIYVISLKNNNSYQKIYSDKDGIFLETAIISFLFLKLFIRKFSNKKLMFTGGFKNMSRSEAKAIAENNGGKVLGSISKKLDFLVVGESKPTKKKIEGQ